MQQQTNHRTPIKWAAGLWATLVAMAVLGACGSSKITIKTATPSAPLPDGKTPATITITVLNNDKPVADSVAPTVKVSTDNGQFVPYTEGAGRDDTTQQSTSVTPNVGVVKVDLYAIKSGTSTITIVYSDTSGGAASATATVVFGTVSSGTPKTIMFISASPDQINLNGSGGQTTSEVTFKVQDVTGAPAKDGITVDFTIGQALGGANVNPTSATTVNGTGMVKTVLSSGSTPGSVSVSATVATDSTITTSSGSITISGSRINGRHFSLSCQDLTIGGLDPEQDGLTINCSVTAADRNNAQVPNTTVSLLSEAGTVPRKVQVSDDTGVGTFAYQSGCPLPVDVDPLGNEYQDTHCSFYNRCGRAGEETEARTCNTRDGIATLVAAVDGEECFNDANNNGKYDDGEFEPACDLGEPFVDANDNGKWDPPCASDPVNCDPHIPGGEAIQDFDNDGTWTPPNGKWDAHWPIWVQKKITWTQKFPTEQHIIVTQATGTANTPVVGNEPCGYGSNTTIHVGDINGNVPAATADQDGFLFTPTSVSTPTFIPLHHCRVDCRLISGTIKCGFVGSEFHDGADCPQMALDANHLPSAKWNWHDPENCPITQTVPFSAYVDLNVTLATGSNAGAVTYTTKHIDVLSGNFIP